MDVRELKDKASQLFVKGKFVKAAEAYDEYCRADHKDLQSRLRLGDAWSKAGKKDKAVAAYAWAAEGFARDGFLPRAIAASKLVLELDPAHTGVQKMLADLYARKSAAPARPRTPGLDHRDHPTVVTPETVSRTNEAPGMAQGFANRPDAIDLDAPITKRPSGLRQVEAPSPLNRPDALELPDDELPLEQGHSSVGGMAAAQGPSPTSRADAIEIELDEPTAPPAALVEQSIEIELAVEPSAGEVEIPIEGVALTEPDNTGLPLELAAALPPLRPSMPPPASFELEVPAPPPSAPPIDLVEEAEPPPEAIAPPLASPPSSLFQSTTSRIRLPAAFTAAASDEAAGSDLERSVQRFTAEPAREAFTELDLDGDSLLHAVEAAAQRAPSFLSSSSAMTEEPMESPEDTKPEPGDLPKIPLFSDLPADAFIALFEQCPLRRFDEHGEILAQGSRGDSFFVICAGRVRVFRTDGELRRDLATLEEGAFFGEMALLSEAPRSASVEAAAEDTQVLEISAALLKELSTKYPTVAQALRKFCRQRLLTNLMSSAAIFRPFGRSDRRDLIQKFRAREVRAGDLIIREGTSSDGLYVVLSGEVEVKVRGERVALLREGEIFGEMSLLTHTAAAASVSSTRHTSLLRLPKEDFDTLILSHPQILEFVAELTDERSRANAARFEMV